ncbi:hypothetical protein [Streptomyces sp. NBC_01546]|uniref:hypothetical protein n=1 Tax=Streptomyces sp. NBC_01546 TaxID=2975872 RepID=UPI003869F6B5
MRGAQQLSLDHGSSGGDPGGEGLGRGSPERGRGPQLGVRERHFGLGRPGRPGGPGRRRLRRYGRRSVRVRERGSSQGGGAVETAGRQQARAHRLSGLGDGPSRAGAQGDDGVLPEADDDGTVRPARGEGAAARGGGVQLLAQPGAELLDGFGEHLGGDGRQ